MTAVIYTLADPRDNSVRYVGKAVSLKERLRGHLRDSKKTHKTNWIKSITDIGLCPIIEELETVRHEDWQEAERFWISYLRLLGFNLVNATIGGDGLNNPSPEVIEKIRASKIGRKHSLETIRKISVSHLGKKFSQETRAKMSSWRKGIPRKPESVAKTNAGNRGKKRTLEVRAKLSAIHIGKTASLETKLKMSTSQKEAWIKRKSQP